MTRKLRGGFTTGSAAAAAAKAGVLLLLGEAVSKNVDIPRADGAGRLAIPLADCRLPGPDTARAVVVKDAGDDPDITHGAEVHCLVELDSAGPAREVRIEGGRGVGRVTRPGLPVEPGRPAINPGPLRQIAAAVREALDAHACPGAVSVLVEVPRGEALAERTLNPRLGIVGGVSILGTRGTVRPYSHEAFTATIDQCLAMARAAGLDHAGLATGGRSERLLRETLPELGAEGVVPVADFVHEALTRAAQAGMRRVTWGLFFGKLVKQAQGAPNTHAKHTPVDFALLAERCRLAGMDADRAKAVAAANTARQVLAMVDGRAEAAPLFALLAEQARLAASRFTGPGLRIDHLLFDFDGRLLFSTLPGTGLTAPGKTAQTGAEGP